MTGRRDVPVCQEIREYLGVLSMKPMVKDQISNKMFWGQSTYILSQHLGGRDKHMSSYEFNDRLVLTVNNRPARIHRWTLSQRIKI